MDNTHKNGTTNGTSKTEGPSDLGKRLRALSDKVIASGVERLSADQIDNFLSQIRSKSV